MTKEELEEGICALIIYGGSGLFVLYIAYKFLHWFFTEGWFLIIFLIIGFYTLWFLILGFIFLVEGISDKINNR